MTGLVIDKTGHSNSLNSMAYLSQALSLGFSADSEPLISEEVYSQCRDFPVKNYRYQTEWMPADQNVILYFP